MPVFHRVRVVCLAFASMLLGSVHAQAQAQAQAQTPASPNAATAALLALPISPGSIALLVEHGNDAGAQQRVREGLKDSRPEVRTVAARVIYGGGLRMLLPELRAALKAEQNATAGAEEARALMTFTPVLAPECVVAAGRLGARTATTVVETFARLNSGDLITHLSALEEAKAESSAVRSALQVLIEADGTLRERLLRERAADPIAIEAALISFRKGKLQPPDDLLIALLNSDTEDVRLIAEWQLARDIAADALKLTPAVGAAVDARMKGTETAVTWEALGLDLIARAANRARHERRWTELPQRDPDKGLWSGVEDRVLFAPLLSKQESLDLATALHLSPETLTKAVESAEIRTFKAPRQEDFVIRTVPRLVGGLEVELLKLTGCATKAQRMVVADVGFRPDGRPRQITLTKDDTVPDSCQQAARVLFSLTVPKFAKPLPATYLEVQVVSLEPDAVACVDEPMPVASASSESPVEGVRVSHKIKAPTRTKMVNPVYPPSVQKEGREGLVIIDATVTPSGCITNGTVLSSPDTRLSAAALLAVMQWHYTPTLLNGVPVPVIMTVTVNFQLFR